MKSSSLAYLSLPSANLNIRKTKSIFCCPGNALISEKLLDFTFSKGRFLGLRPEILSTILNIYNSRLFSEFLQKNKATLKLLKSDEVGQDFSQSIIPKIDVSEIEMGELGNSLFISAISALIETPIILFGLIDQINLSKTENIYIIFINQNGSWRELFLDGMFPYQIDFILEDNKGLGASAKKNSTKKEIEKKTLYFSRLKNNSANWLSLLEKAYAFAYGSYQKMLNCLLEDILYDFTGAVVETNEIIRMSNFELGDLLLKDFNKGSPMLLIEEDISDRLNNLYLKKETCNQWGIPIIDVRNTKTEYIIVKIRTLKPIKTQKLMYNKGSNNWPPDLKAELAIKFDPANAIWLSLDEIKEMFSNLIICKVNMQNFHKSIVFEFSNFDALSYAICEIQHNENFLLGITVCQDDLREFKLASKYKYSKVRLFIIKVINTENRIKFINAVYGERRNVGIDLMLEKGTYLIYFEIEWDNFKFSSSKKIKMNFYSEFNCQIKIMSNSIDFRKNLLSNIFGNISNIQKTKQTSKINNFIKKLSDNIHLIYGVFLNYYYLIVKNSILLKQCYKLKLEIALKGSFYTDLTLQTKDFSDKEIKLFLPSNKDLILIFKITELIDINPKIIKALKLTEKIKTSAQNYELLPFSFQLIKPNNNSLNNYDSKNKLFDKPPRELGPLIKELGKLNKRIVNEQEIEVGAWILTFEEGIAILIENYMENHIYFEKIYHKTQNLEIVIEKNQKRVKYFKNYLEVRLEPFKYALMKWKQKNNINIYSYNFKSIFFIDNFSYKSKFSF